jgi:hypothetical protein
MQTSELRPLPASHGQHAAIFLRFPRHCRGSKIHYTLSSTTDATKCMQHTPSRALTLPAKGGSTQCEPLPACLAHASNHLHSQAMASVTDTMHHTGLNEAWCFSIVVTCLPALCHASCTVQARCSMPAMHAALPLTIHAYLNALHEPQHQHGAS